MLKVCSCFIKPKQKKMWLSTYMAAFVHFIVGQLDLLEWDHLFAQLLHTVRGIRVQVETGGRGRVRLAGHQPAGAVVGVPVPLVVHRHNVHHHQEAAVAVQRYLVDAREGAPYGGEHASERKKKMIKKRLEELNTISL